MYRNDKHNINITKEYYEYLKKGHTYEVGNILLTYKQFRKVAK